MKSYLKQRWFLVALTLSIPIGIGLGLGIPAAKLDGFSKNVAGGLSRVLVAVVLFLMSVTLDTRKLTAALRSPAPTIWASVVNYGFLPLCAIPLAWFQWTDDFAVGLLIAASVPSTMASASVWTRKANGNDAVSLLVTILTNGLCFLATPFWLAQTLGDTISLDVRDMIERLFVTAVIPIGVGQFIRGRQSIREAADRWKTPIGVVAQSLILVLIFWSSVQGGSRLQGSESSELGVGAVAVAWLSCIVLHCASLVVVFVGGRVARFDRPDVVATVFSGSQKTLAIGIYIAMDLLSQRNLPFAAFPILMFHVSQLFLDTLLIDPLGRWVNRGQQYSTSAD
ncbi:bile acid:sodium symporter [Thalassoglobus sp. JC818]|uniref:bile acid:sodium symporter family protein n=1 Tax=Thalassoglobus sp. JC818 TaxID=3232136 RepID=UPI003457D802